MTPQISADDKVPVETLPIRQPLFVKPNLRLLEMLSMFREGRCHMALVTEDPISAMRCMSEGRRPSSDRSSIIGIVTLEDVIEEIIQGIYILSNLSCHSCNCSVLLSLLRLKSLISHISPLTSHSIYSQEKSTMRQTQCLLCSL